MKEESLNCMKEEEDDNTHRDTHTDKRFHSFSIF